MIGGDDQVGRHRDLEPAADRHAVDRGDHRRGTVGQFGKSAEPADAVVAVEVLACRQIPTRREELRPGTGEDDRPNLGVTVEPREHVAHRLAGCRVDRVGLRSIDRDDGGAAVQLDVESGHSTLLQPQRVDGVARRAGRPAPG